MSETLFTQINDYFSYVDEEQGAVDLMTLRERRMDGLTVRPLQPPTMPTQPPRRGWLVAVVVAAGVLVVVGGAAFLLPATRSDAPVATASPTDPFSSSTWSRVLHDEAVFGGEMRSVTVGGPGLVAVGSGVWTSVDGLTWSRVPHDETVFDTRMASVTVGGPGLVAVGGQDRCCGRAVVWTSVDGITWSRVPHDAAVFGGNYYNDPVPAFAGRMASVTVGGPGLVAVGEVDETDAAVWTSPDGIAWSRVPHDEEVFGGEGSQSMESVTAGGPGLVAVGWDNSGGDEDAAVWTSPDGITWSRVPHNETVFGGEYSQSMVSLTAGGPGLVAVGSAFAIGGEAAAVWTSPDGIAWSRVPHDQGVFGGHGNQRMASVTAGGPGLVAVGSGRRPGGRVAAAWASVDGITWARVPHNDAVLGGEGDQQMLSVTAGGPGVVAVGSEGDLGLRILLYSYRHAAVWNAPTED